MMEQEEKKGPSVWSTKKKVGVTIAVVVVLYALIAVFFQFHFFPGTEINGYQCGFRSVGKVKEMIQEGVEEYSISIKERDEIHL